MDDKVNTLRDWIAASDNIVFFGGAGVSTESGIKDFRSPDGLYNQHYKFPPETMLSRSFFDAHPEEFFRFYRDKMLNPGAKPNAAHKKLAELEAAGKLDDTVIVLSADHYPYGLTDEEYSELFGHTVDPVFEIYENSLILWSADLEEPVHVDKYCSSLDVMPTLANLFGLEYDSRLMAGRDILSDEPGLVIFSNYSFLTDQGAYDSTTDTFTMFDGSEPDPDYVAERVAEVQNRVAYSASILDWDYYRVVFGDGGSDSG